jgi:cell division topological specificity factor
MGFFRFFRGKNADDDASAKVAKDRLQVLIAHERTGRNGPDYLPKLKQDILEVIKKYVSVEDEQVSVQLDTQDQCDVLELNITLPETTHEGPRAEPPRKSGTSGKKNRIRASSKVT